MDGRKGTELTKFEWDMLYKYFDIKDTEYLDVKYQFRVGKIAMEVEGVDRKMMREIMATTRLKIDCVAKRNDGVTEIIEVKRVASAGAVGQLLTYKYHHRKEYHDQVELVLVCNYITNDVNDVCEKYKITVVVINE